MSTSKFIVPLSAVLLAAGLTALPESAFAKRCTQDQRKPVPSCVFIMEEDLKVPLERISGGTGFKKGYEYRISNNCNRTIKIHEDVKGARDRGFKMADGDRIHRHSPIGWFARFRKIECCDIKTPGYHYTCGGRSE